MTLVVRNASHGNGIRVIYFSDAKMYRKVTFNAWGKVLLENECAGIQWYSRCCNKNSNCNIKLYSHQSYARLDFPELSGAKVHYSLCFSQAIDCWERIVTHYVSKWAKRERVPCHGDLTLDNVLLSSNSAVLIDWEHFQLDGEVWGFDLCYLTLSMIALPYLKSGEVQQKDWVCFEQAWSKLIKLGIARDLTSSPIDYFVNVFNTGSGWKNIIKHSPRKMFPLILDKKIINSIQKRISNVMTQGGA
jgi:hypothetical protein